MSFSIQFNSFFSAGATILVLAPLRLVFTCDGVIAGVVIGSLERYDLVKINLKESEAGHRIRLRLLR